MDAPILDISVELHAEIARFLSPVDCSRLAATCSTLKPIYCSDLIWSRYLPPSISSVVGAGGAVQWSARALYVDLLIRAEVNLTSGNCQFTPLAPGRCCLVEDALQVEYGVGDEVLLSHIHSVLKPFPRTLEHRAVESRGSTNGSAERSYDEEEEERPALTHREYEIGSSVPLEPIVLPLPGPRVNKVHLVEITPDIIAIGHSLNGGSISLFSRQSLEHIATRMTGLRSGLVPIEMTISEPYVCVLTLGGMLWAWRLVYDDKSEYASDVVFLGRVRVSTSQYRKCKAPHFVIAPRDTEQWNEVRMKGITAEITRQWDENHYIVATDIFENRVKSWQLSALPNSGILKMFERDDDDDDDDDDVMPLDCSTSLSEREYCGVLARGMFCHDRKVLAMASNQCLAWTSDDSLLISAPEVTDIRPIREPVCACMRGSSLVVAYEDGELYSVDFESCAKFHVSMPVPCTCITLSHIPRFVIVGTIDGYVRVCDMKLGKELYEMVVPGSIAVDRVHFDASSFILVAYGRAGGVVCRFAGKPTLLGNEVTKDSLEETVEDVLVVNLSSDGSLSRYELKRAQERCCTPWRYIIRWAGGFVPPLLAIVVIVASLWLMREQIAFKMHNGTVEALIYFWVVLIFFAIAILFCAVLAGVTLFGLSYAVQNDMLHGHDHA